MTKVTLHLESAAWAQTELVEGEFLQRGTIWQDTDALYSAKNAAAFSEQLQALNGFFAVVRRTAGLLMAAVDHIRSVPLFYGLKNGHLFLADDAEWVRKKIGDHEMDARAREEFILAGYVTGRNTLYPNVKQLQAGEYLIAEADELGDISLSLGRYFRFVHKDPGGCSHDKLWTYIDSAAVSSIQRLIKYANKRQILVPLSGGYDSRLIASLLKRSGYENVLCFSYGIARNKEAEYSEKIAKSLGFAWCFAEYTNEEWASEWNTGAAEEYRSYASNHTSLPHIQDWLAIKKLIENKLIDDDAVVVPGHCCVTGYIPKDIVSKRFGKREYFNNIIETHFSGRPLRCSVLLTEAELTKALLNCEIDFCDKDEVASRAMEYNWAERQAKYITNSVRVYENFGLDWWLPLWDMEFVNAWMVFPLRLRLERRFYKSYVTDIYNSEVPDESDRVLGNSADKSRLSIWLRSVVEPFIPDFVVRAAKKRRYIKYYKNHFLGFGGLMGAEELEFYTKSGFTIIGAYSSLYIAGSWGRDRRSDDPQ